MTNTCMCKRGFFILRDCSSEALKACQTCNRPICNQHLSPLSGMLVCVECVARQQQNDDVYDPGWAYGYRHRYYSTEHYQPIYWGSSSGDYYDDYDFRSFEQDMAEDRTEGDFGGGGSSGDFYES